MAAGGSVEPFWSLYAQHKTEQVMKILESLRIGNVDAVDLKAMSREVCDIFAPSMNIKSISVFKIIRDVKDPYGNDPIRHPALMVNSQKPFNAETPPSLLIDSFQTPNELFFVRNHMPVPIVRLYRFYYVVQKRKFRQSKRIIAFKSKASAFCGQFRYLCVS